MINKEREMRKMSFKKESIYSVFLPRKVSNGHKQNAIQLRRVICNWMGHLI